MAFNIEFVGYFAGVCTAFAQFPQANKVIKTGNTSSISVGTYAIMTFGVFCWFIYGVLIPNFPMIIANGICLVPSSVVLFISMRNKFLSKQ